MATEVDYIDINTASENLDKEIKARCDKRLVKNLKLASAFVLNDVIYLVFQPI